MVAILDHARRQQSGGNCDIGALFYLTLGQARNTQDFTRSSRLLLRAIDNIMPGAGGQLIEGRSQLISRTQPNYLGGPRTRMESLRALTESLAQIRGRRKVVFYITEELGMDIFDTLDHAGGTKSIAFDDLHAALSAATRGNIAIHPVDPSGLALNSVLSEAVDQQRSSGELASGMNGFTVSVPLTGSTTGDHVLYVEARANVDDPLVVSHNVPIRIR